RIMQGDYLRQRVRIRDQTGRHVSAGERATIHPLRPLGNRPAPVADLRRNAVSPARSAAATRAHPVIAVPVLLAASAHVHFRVSPGGRPHAAYCEGDSLGAVMYEEPRRPVAPTPAEVQYR